MHCAPVHSRQTCSWLLAARPQSLMQGEGRFCFNMLRLALTAVSVRRGAGGNHRRLLFVWLRRVTVRPRPTAHTYVIGALCLCKEPCEMM